MLLILIFVVILAFATLGTVSVWSSFIPLLAKMREKSGFAKSLGALLGVMTTFTLFVLAISYSLDAMNLDPATFKALAKIVILSMAIFLMFPKFSANLDFYLGRISNFISPIIQSKEIGFISGFIAGLSLGILWLPCVGVILLPVSLLSVLRSNDTEMLIVLAVHIVFLGVLLTLLALYNFIDSKKLAFVKKNIELIQSVVGIFLITVFLVLNYDLERKFSFYISKQFPALGFLNVLELRNKESVNRSNLALYNNRNKLQASNNEQNSESSLPNFGSSPRLAGLENLINAENLDTATLHEKNILIYFWNYSCLDCVRILPYISSWNDKYKEDDLVIISIHVPEFDYERDINNLKSFITLNNLKFPIATDNNYATWNNFKNLSSPAVYLVDKNSDVRFYKQGEFKPLEVELAIQQLLAKTVDVTDLNDFAESTYRITPDTHLGVLRQTSLTASQALQLGDFSYIYGGTLEKDKFAFSGLWNITPDVAVTAGQSSLNLNFDGKKVYMILEPASLTENITVYLDGKLVSNDNAGKDVKDGRLVLKGSNLYELVNLKDATSGNLQIRFTTKGNKLYTINFL